MTEHYYNNHCEELDETGHCFKSLTVDQQKYLEDNENDVTYYKGETILKQGTESNYILYLKEGLVKLSMQSNDKYLILTLKTKNHFIGLETFRLTKTNPYTATVLEDSKVTHISRDVFANLVNQNKVFANEVFNLINFNTIMIYERMFSLTQKQLHGRLADILLCLSGKIFKSDKFELPLSRRDLAALTSMAPESVIRIIKDFKTDQLIKTSGKKMEILNKERLKKISSYG